MLRALNKIGWKEGEHKGGSHVQLRRAGLEFTWSFHPNDEIGPVMLARIAKHTGLQPKDL